MNTPSPPNTIEREDFSLVLGGPLYQFFVRVGLVLPPLNRAGVRILVISMVAWLPLLVMTALDGRLLGGVHISFLRDIEVHVRLLIALPLLIAAEVTIHRRMRTIVSQFVERRIITQATMPRFLELIESAKRLRNSVPAELCLLVVVILIGGFWWHELVAMQVDTWYRSQTAGGPIKSPAGFWYRYVSLPIIQFLSLRWYFRIFIWVRFLRQVSKLDLHLVPTHPDESCGLGFLDGIVIAMGPLLLAHSCLLSGALATRILYERAKLPDHYFEIGAMAAILALISLGPLCLFTGRLLQARLIGLRQYGRLASDYVIGFERKWIGGERSPEEPLVGSADIQSMADLATSFDLVKSIIPFPFGKSSLIGLAVIVALPQLPLVLTMFSLQELALRLVKLVF